ncbi:hypothetical protein A6A04_03765 [Paramagnetospirillum marisnigri]|uniref:Uncharacterized protein n=1 Tax=Paramagnetospirillum marisnigri TaxID=1285242 RepID=A0A178MKH7_9PROT|nr:hypothetical protein [Paramagnetospirillum marisnigri]OAN49242.1 hypothetical protein A6A04_03765 [Paramagnetospirillum marisnigri]
MTILLRTSRDLPAADQWRSWLAVTESDTSGLESARKLPRLAHRLEAAFDAAREDWWSLARQLAKSPGAHLSHTVACGAFGSDFGLMLAWDRMARELAAEAEPYLMVCDDAWMFRHLAALPGVEAGAPPPLALVEGKRAIRGFAARGKLALRMILSVLKTRSWRGAIASGDPVLLVYGHPGSRADGFDVYFGTLMAEMPGIKRLLHCDCPPERVAQLAADGRTASLHAWGSALFALTLPLRAWRPSSADLSGRFGWLVRRAASRENGGGGPAMNAWQMHCQRRFLKAARPGRICWPWENHAWERDLCRAARSLDIRTIGYQHTVIGPHQINYSPRANLDGLASLPDIVAADGPAYATEMVEWDIPAARIVDAGAWRLPPVAGGRYDATAQVFVPLSAIPAIARMQVDAARAIARTGRKVLVKQHPMYPLAFAPEANLEPTETGITGHAALSAVIAATGTSSLEGLLLGLPTFRLLPDDRLAVDILPKGVKAVAVTPEELPEVLATTPAPAPLDHAALLSPPDRGTWKSLMFGDIPAAPVQERD